MCGIVGELRFDSSPVSEERLRAMLAAVAHRGPDGSGVVCLGPVGLGHARLAIVDLSSDGAQPMANEDGTVWVTFNGEIYNHQELRDGLIEAGHTFKSRSDTEVLVHLYEEYGSGFVDRLRGMYAFALWDGRTRRLLLARDRVGKKPLFYAQRPDGIRFASELRALTLAGVGQIDPVAVHHYLTLQYVPAPLTAFRDIRRLPPASTMVVELSGTTEGRGGSLGVRSLRQGSSHGLAARLTELHGQRGATP
jgi:asparagine synthase (glutamine-hydrolysing)